MRDVIRAAEPRDFEAVEAIENEADQLFIDLFGPVSWGPAPSGVSRASEPGFLLVATGDSGALVGFIHVAILSEQGIAHLEQLSVMPAQGRRGYGSALVEAAKSEARRRGHDRLTLRTYADVPWNAPFYWGIGFLEEEPVTPFHEHLVVVEERLGLGQYGRRVQMGIAL